MVWSSKSKEERNCLFQKLLDLKVPKIRKEKYQISTNFLLKLPKTPRSARKPGQRKRVCSAKTKSSKRLKLE